jgi:predicted transposase YbfD/YdcC
MPREPINNIKEHFAGLSDPRSGNAIQLKLIDIIVIAICAVICGADSWVDVENFGRVFARLDAEEFQRRFLRWVQAVMKTTQEQVVAIDGKALRRSHDSTLGKEAIYMVSAWATTNHLVLGQRKVDEGSNEITAVP